MYAGCHLSLLFAVHSAVVSPHCIYIYICSFEYACSKLLHWSLSLQVLPDLYLGNFKGVYKCFFFFSPSWIIWISFIWQHISTVTPSFFHSVCLCVFASSDARDREQLARNNITHILSIHDSAAPILQVKLPPSPPPWRPFSPPPHTSRISHQFFKESDEARGPNRSDWLSPDPPPLPPRISAHDWSSDTVPWTGVSGLLRRKLRL